MYAYMCVVNVHQSLNVKLQVPSYLSDEVAEGNGFEAVVIEEAVDR
jgi:hypothetical protein